MNHDPDLTGDFDAIVVGGRIAGCATAINLSKQGLRVLVIDRVQFPKTTVSTHLMKPDSVKMLKTLGVLPDIEAAGAPALKWFRQDFDGFAIQGSLPALSDCDYGYSIRREQLDNVLVSFTKKQPTVVFLERFVATELIWRDNTVVGIRGMHDGVRKEVRGRIVIGADGQFSFVAQAVGAPMYWRVPIGRAAYYCYFRNVQAAQQPSIEIFVRKEEWFYLFPTDGNMHLVAIGVDNRRRSEFADDRYRAFVQSIGRCAELASRLSGAEPIDRVYQAYFPRAANYMRRPFGPGWALVGDSGMYFDPTLGQGMGTALRSAEILAEELSRPQPKRRRDAKHLVRYEMRRNWEAWDLYAYTCSVSPARAFSSLERWFYRKVSENRQLTEKYLGVASHTSRVQALLFYCLRHPQAVLRKSSH